MALEGVSKRFLRGSRRILALDGVDLAVAEGEVLCVIGPSGCGKSTALNLLAGLTEPTAGTVHYRGAPVSGPNRAVGYITQKDNLMPWRTVRDNIGFPLELRRVDSRTRRSRVDDIIALVGLTGFRDAYPAELSGGMRKRVGLARTLIYEPETILADEPFGALDAQLRLVMLDEFQQLQARTGASVLFVTHDLSEAITLGDRVVVFTGRPGRVKLVCDVPFGRPRDVYRMRFQPGFGELFETLWEALAEDMRGGEEM
jgi:NitT/TauT family transport system ATP-binding protein